MEQQYNGDTVTVWVDGAKIVQMDQNDMSIFHTPGSSRVYIDSRPQFADDYGVASVADLLDALGYDDSDGLTADDVAELTFEVR